MKKGFTLLELLAVIVVLAIVALIALPAILRIIDNAKKSSAIDSAYGIKEIIKYQYVSDTYVDISNNAVGFTCDFSDSSCDILGITGTKPSSGVVTISVDGILTFENFVIDGYHIVYDPYTEKFSIPN